MSKRTLASWIAVGAALALALATYAEVDARPERVSVFGSPRLDIHSTAVFEYGVPLGRLFLAKDWSVASNGTYSSIVRWGSPQGSFGPFVETRLGRAPADVLRQLSQGIAAAHLGTLPGNCNPWTTAPDDSFRIEITWYGKPGRRNHVVLSTALPEPCPAEVVTLLQALQSFEGALVDPLLPI